LETGVLLRDYIKQSDKVNYKIYKFTPSRKDSSYSTKITLTNESGDFKFYVFNNKFNGTIQFDENQEPLGYSYLNIYNGDIVIQNETLLYILVMEYFNKFNSDKTENRQITRSYIIGATDDNRLFYLKEGIPNSISLFQNYTSQTYIYYHYNTTESLFISFNVYFGNIDIYVGFKQYDALNESNVVFKKLNSVSSS